LAEIAHGKLPIFHIESADDILSHELIRARDPISGTVKEIKPWFPKHTRNIGLTSGASTPDLILQKVIEKIRTFSDV
jgi:4-hydroxy-3-methylbut-2-enyl diphosphate reductase IspH